MVPPEAPAAGCRTSSVKTQNAKSFIPGGTGRRETKQVSKNVKLKDGVPEGPKKTKAAGKHVERKDVVPRRPLDQQRGQLNRTTSTSSSIILPPLPIYFHSYFRESHGEIRVSPAPSRHNSQNHFSKSVTNAKKGSTKRVVLPNRLFSVMPALPRGRALPESETPAQGRPCG